MANKLQQLTNADKNEVLSGTSKVLPLRPSDNGWTAEQIREKGYQGIEKLFEYLSTAIDATNNGFDEVENKLAQQEEAYSLFTGKIENKLGFHYAFSKKFSSPSRFEDIINKNAISFSLQNEGLENLGTANILSVYSNDINHKEHTGLTAQLDKDILALNTKYVFVNGLESCIFFDTRSITYKKYNGELVEKNIGESNKFIPFVFFALANQKDYGTQNGGVINFYLIWVYEKDGKIVFEKSNSRFVLVIKRTEIEFNLDIGDFEKLEIGGGNVDIEEIVNQIKQLQEFATKEDLQNVIEIAEGKTKSYLLSCNDIIQEEFLPYMTYYNARGEVLTSEQVMNIVNNGTCVNNLFNSQDNQVPVWDISNWYLIIEYNYPVMQNNSKVIITNMDNPFKQGDILIVTETDVPDRYATDVGIFYKMETSKVDLSTVVHKTGDETIAGVKNFTGTLQVKGNSVENGLIKVITNEEIRTAEMSAGIYLWTNSTRRLVYYRGLTNTTNVDLGGGTCILKVWLLENGTRSFEVQTGNQFNTIINGYSEQNTNNGGIFYRYPNSPLWLVNEQSYVTKIYAPTTKGENGQVLVSDGSNTPVFKNVFVSLTQDEYDALSTKDENVLYLIKE